MYHPAVKIHKGRHHIDENIYGSSRSKWLSSFVNVLAKRLIGARHYQHVVFRRLCVLDDGYRVPGIAQIDKQELSLSSIDSRHELGDRGFTTYSAGFVDFAEAAAVDSGAELPFTLNPYLHVDVSVPTNYHPLGTAS